MYTKRCGGTLHYAVIGTMRVYRMEGRKKLYRFRCSRCGAVGENNGRTKTCSNKLSG
jgi:hypothetical protein